MAIFFVVSSEKLQFLGWEAGPCPLANETWIWQFAWRVSAKSRGPCTAPVDSPGREERSGSPTSALASKGANIRLQSCVEWVADDGAKDLDD